MAKAIFRLISRNERKGTYRGTDEELLQEVVDEFRDAFELDRSTMEDDSEEDFSSKYPTFMKKVADKADLFKQNAHGYRRICCLPSFAFGLVMASRIPSHYTHAPWFKLGTLSEMIDVHGAVSKRVDNITNHLMRMYTVHLRVYRRKRGVSGADREPGGAAPQFWCHQKEKGRVRSGTGWRKGCASNQSRGHERSISETGRFVVLDSRCAPKN
jgi:hypothetical protein